MLHYKRKFLWMMALFFPLCPLFANVESADECEEMQFQLIPQTFTSLRASERNLATGREFTHTFNDMEYKLWGEDNVFETNILIDRYFGTREQIAKQIQRGLIAKKVTLTLPNYDSDITYEGDKEIVPEYDHLYFNGHYISLINGDNETTYNGEYRIPTSYVNFPKRPGAVARNHIVIDIDTGNEEDMWILGQHYQKLTIDAVPPVMLVHGWTDDSNSLYSMKRHIERNFGIPCEMPDVGFHVSAESNAEFLLGYMNGMLADYNCPKINIVAHSKGGIDSRFLIDARGLNSRSIQNLLQISTPNAGSRLADLLINPQKWWEEFLAWGYTFSDEEATEESEALQALSTAQAAQFNATYCLPNAPIHTVMGRLGNHEFTNYYTWLGKLCYDHDDTSPDPNRHGDGVVAVTSAHAIGTAVGASPLRESSVWNQDTDHTAIINSGASRSFATLYPYIRKPLSGYLASHSVSLRTRNMIASTSTLRSDEADSSDDQQTTASASIAEQKTALQKELSHINFSGGIQKIGQVLPGGSATDVEIPLIRVRSDGEVFSFSGLPEETQYTIFAPDGTELSDVQIGEANFFGKKLMLCKLPEGSVAGTYRLRCDVPGESTTGYPICVNVTAYDTLEIAVHDTVDYNYPSRSVKIRAKILYGEDITSTDTPEFTLFLEPLQENGTRDESASEDAAVKVTMTAAEDGWYEAEVTPERLGYYKATVYMEGEFNNVKQTRSASVQSRVTDVTVEKCGIAIKEIAFNSHYNTDTGLATELYANIDIVFRRNGKYKLSGELYSPSGVKCGSAISDTISMTCIESGTSVRTSCYLTFPADIIYATGESGVYTLRNILVTGESDDTKHLKLYSSDAQYPTDELRYEAFAPYAVCVNSLYKDYRESLTNEETPAYQYLSAEFKIMVAPDCGGTYVISANLVNKSGTIICDAEIDKHELKDCIEADGEQTVKIQFDGTKIREFGEDGPYYIEGISFVRQAENRYAAGSKNISRSEIRYLLRGNYKSRDFTFNLIEVENTLCRWGNLEFLEKNDSTGEYTIRLTCNYNLATGIPRSYDSKYDSLTSRLFSATLNPVDGITGFDRSDLKEWVTDSEKLYVALGVYMYDCYLFPPIKAKYDTKLDSGITILTTDEEITQQITTQLPNIGNHDDILDIGETFYVDLKVKCESDFDFTKWTPMVTLTGKAMLPYSRNFYALRGLMMCHIADTNADYEIDLDEAINAIDEWHNNTIDNAVLLEALELSGEDKYHYDTQKARFYPGRDYTLYSRAGGLSPAE